MTKFKSPFKFQLPDRQILFDFWDMDIGYYLIISAWLLVFLFRVCP